MIPLPAAIAHALQWGTPGHGSGRRRRHSPGRTRSPRPSSRWLLTRRTILAARRLRRLVASTSDIAMRYFEALSAHDLDAAVACWEPGGVDKFVGQLEVTAPDGVRQYFADVFAAFPDFTLEILDLTTARNRTAVRWRAEA